MTLPTSGAISAAMINAEWSRTAGWSVSLDDQYFRGLCGVPGSGNRVSYSNFYGKSAYTNVSAVGNNVDVEGTSSSTTTSYFSGGPSVTPSGGNGNYTYSWTITSGLGTLSANTSRICNVSRTVAKNGNAIGTTYLQCVVSDGTSSVTVTNIQVTWNVSSGM